MPLTLPAEGGCRCGALRIRVTAPPMMTFACHCRGCQHMSGGAFSLTAAIPEDGFEVTAGNPLPGGMKSPDIVHSHCPECLAWVFTRAAGLPGYVNLRPTMLDDPAWFVPFIETCAAEKLPWATTPARHSYDTYPDPAEYPELIAEFAAILASQET